MKYILTNPNKKQTLMKKIIYLLLGMFFFIPAVQAQTCPPTPSAPGTYVMFDTNYVSGTVLSGKTDIQMCFANTSPDSISGIQFRIWYDKNAFGGAIPTVTSLNVSFAQDLQFKADTTEGYITVTLVYTGSSSTFDIPDGPLFGLRLFHSANFWMYEGAITDMKITGVTPFTNRASDINGADKVLTAYNYGGNINPMLFNYHGTFTNVTGSAAKDLTVALERKPKTTGSWTNVTTTTTNILGNFAFNNQPIDTTYYDVRLKVQGDTLAYGNIVTTADAQKINDFVLERSTPVGFDFYSSDVNGSNDITISDVYSVFGRIAGRFSTWPNNVKDVKFFTAAQYNTISTSATNLTGSISGVTNLTFDIIAGQPDSVTFYVLGMGDANGTGYHMARMIPIEIVNPSNAPNRIIDQTIEFDNTNQTIELNLPLIPSVQEGNLLDVPVKVLCNDNPLGSMQFGIKYDQDLLEFTGIENKEAVSNWIYYINPSDNIVDWGGYDPTGGNNLIYNDQTAFTLKFIAKKPKDAWGISPLWVTRKAAGNAASKDFGITPTDGIIKILRMTGGNISVDNGEMEVYPNPTNGLVTVTFRIAKPVIANLGIYNTNGKRCMDIFQNSVPIGKYSYSIDLGALPEGIYTAVLSTDNSENKFVAKKIIKIN
jgi:hypothetical protein